MSNRIETTSHGEKTVSHRLALCIAGTAAAVSLAAGLALSPVLNSTSAIASQTAVDSTTMTVDEQGTTLAEYVAAKCLPSVGTVYALVQSGGSYGLAEGSCVVIDTEGHVITNFHVIEGSTQIEVDLNGSTYEAEIVGSDSTSDLAVLKIDAGNDELIPMDIGSSSDLRVGEWVMTIGSPMGVTSSVSQGIVSGVGRSDYYDLETAQAIYTNLIQTDAMINSGSSGGALVNSDGALVGITTLSYSTTGDFAGMSFAIPSDYAMRVVTQILENGVVEHPFLGVNLYDVNPYNYSNHGAMNYFGALVSGVTEGGAAEAAGLQAGDVIIAIDGKQVYSATDVVIGIREHEIGELVPVTVERDGQEMTIDVTLGSDLATSATDADQPESDIFSIFGDGSLPGGPIGQVPGDQGSWGWGGPGGGWGYWSYDGEDGSGFGWEWDWSGLFGGQDGNA